jgi:hypothetical protein
LRWTESLELSVSESPNADKAELTEPLVEKPSSAFRYGPSDGMQETSSKEAIANGLLDLKRTETILVNAHYLHVFVPKRGLQFHVQPL